MSYSSVSVVIPHYGDPAPTVALVESLQRQKPFHGDNTVGQIVVVDDCSPEPFPERTDITVVRRVVNGGFGSAVNSGMAVAECDLALVLNSDLEVGETFVEELLASARPWQPVVASPQVIGRDGAPQWVGRHFPTTYHMTVEWLSFLARFRHLRPFHEAVGHDSRCVDGAVVPVDWVFGAAMLIPLAEFRRIGGFDEGFFMNSEEVDLQLRFRSVGVPSVFFGTVRVTHEGGGSSDPARRRQWLVDSRLRYARKWGSERSLKLALRSASVINFLANSGRELIGRDVDAMATLRAELAYVKGPAL